ncbi:MAG: glycosyltransferase family 2 protein [Bacillota bacterium]
MIDLSIIIPHYNSVTLLGKLLGSIPNRENIDIIVVDDRSDTNIYEFDEIKLKNSHVKFISNSRTNKGAGAARNCGLEQAKGRWVLFADADDYFLPHFYDVVERYSESDSDIIFFKPTSIELDTGNISDRHVAFCDAIDKYMAGTDNEDEVRRNIVVPWSKLIKRSLITKYDIWFDEIMVSNDMMFSVKAGYYADKISVSNEQIYCVTRNVGTLTTVVSAESFITRTEVQMRYIKFWDDRHGGRKRMNDYNGLDRLVYCVSLKLGYKCVIDTYKLLRRNGVKIFRLKYLNILAVPRRLGILLRTIFKKNKYINKKN